LDAGNNSPRHHLSAKLDRATTAIKKSARNIDEMKAKAAGIVEGDLIKPETFLGACAGVDVLVSAVGNNEVTVPG
jgi:putative NADH-flavin reductase